MTPDQARIIVDGIQQKVKEYTASCESYIKALERHIVELKTKLDKKNETR